MKTSTASPLPPAPRQSKQISLFLLALLIFTVSICLRMVSWAEVVPEQLALRDGIYEISKPEHLAWFRDTVNGGNINISAKLMNDIDLSKNSAASEWLPIGQDSHTFNGTFDGGGHTVSGYLAHNVGGGGPFRENCKK
ncbi:hypothetical protein [Cloacibacillus sp.]